MFHFGFVRQHIVIRLVFIHRRFSRDPNSESTTTATNNDDDDDGVNDDNDDGPARQRRQRTTSTTTTPTKRTRDTHDTRKFDKTDRPQRRRPPARATELHSLLATWTKHARRPRRQRRHGGPTTLLVWFTCFILLLLWRACLPLHKNLARPRLLALSKQKMCV